MDVFRFVRVRPSTSSPALTFRVEKRIFDILNERYVIFKQVDDDPDLFSIEGEDVIRPIPSDYRVRELDCLFSGLLRSATEPQWDSLPFRQLWSVLKAEVMLGAPCATLALQPESSDAPLADTSLSHHFTTFFELLFESLNVPLEKRDIYRRSIQRCLKRLSPGFPVVFEAPVDVPDATARIAQLTGTVSALTADVEVLTAQRSALTRQISGVAHRTSRRPDEVRAERKNMRVVTDLMFFIDDLNLSLVERGN
jgi:hypothetical protein